MAGSGGGCSTQHWEAASPGSAWTDMPQHPSGSSRHPGRDAALLPVLPKFLPWIWEAWGKLCILGFTSSGLGAVWCGMASAVLRIRPCHAGIVMFAVGVGKAVEEELRAIASEPVEQHFSYSVDFTTMTHLVENFKLNICPGGCPPAWTALSWRESSSPCRAGMCDCHTVSRVPGCLWISSSCCGYRGGSQGHIWKRKKGSYCKRDGI